jgi:hypothetical protein
MFRKPRSCSFALVAAIALALPAASFAQASASIDTRQQQDMENTRSILQKTGLGTLAVTGVLGLGLMVNRPTLFGDGLCARSGDAWFGDFGCSPGLTLAHFAFAAASLGLFVASEIYAAEMPVSPYDTDDLRKRDAERTLRVVNIGLFAVQPVLGILGAHPNLFGLSGTAADRFSRVMRTVHFGVGLTAASGYAVNAALQW